MPSNLLPFWGFLASVVVIMATAAVIATFVAFAGRLDDLETRMTTFEAVRIEVVAPAEDSG